MTDGILIVRGSIRTLKTQIWIIIIPHLREQHGPVSSPSKRGGPLQAIESQRDGYDLISSLSAGDFIRSTIILRRIIL
jgi:hypothetical protein